MSVVEVTREGLGSRTGKSFGGVLFGFLLIALSTFLLFWNEGRAVKRYEDLKEGAGAVVSAPSDQVDAAFEGKLVHTSGEAVTDAVLIDPIFGVSETAIHLSRSVEMYQWVEEVETEKKTNTGGSVDTKKTYTYTKEWRSNPIDSSIFKSTGHDNPGEIPYRSESWTAGEVKLGAFQLPDSLIARIGGATQMDVSSLEKAEPSVRDNAVIDGDTIYFGTSPASPQVGDIRVQFQAVHPGPISIVAQQQGDSFIPYRTRNGSNLALLERGLLPAEEMFAKAEARNKIMTWAIRGGGFVLLMVGFNMILGPIAVMASILPILGRLAEAGTGLISFLLAGVVWTVVVGIAWIFYRPILGISILIVTVALLTWIVLRVRASRRSTATAGAGGGGDAPPPLDTPPPLT